MDLFLKSAAAVLLAVVLILAIGRRGQDIGILLSMAVCCLVAAAAIEYLRPVVDFLKQLETLSDLNTDMLEILLKAVGIGMISEIVGMVCADAGNASLGKALQLLGTAVILWLSIPLFTGLMELIQKILGGV